MSDILIFGGTTEGRELAVFCAENHIPADVCVATGYGASVLPVSEFITIRAGRLDCDGIRLYIKERNTVVAVDATHPYAEEVTKNIKSACAETGVAYYRLLREEADVSYGIRVRDMAELTAVLNSSDNVVLSTLGSKEAAGLTAVNNFSDRIWIRALPDEKIRKLCTDMGYDENKLILEKGPFTIEQNTEHIRRSGAETVITKESGKAGGYAEKAEAARICGVQLITLARPYEEGYSQAEITDILLNLHTKRKIT